MREKRKKLKPEWKKTDIPKDICIKLWRVMKDNFTYDSWAGRLAQLSDITEEELLNTPTSKDSYTQLKNEIIQMPLSEVETLPQDLQDWIFQLRPDLLNNGKQFDEKVIPPETTDDIINHDKRIFTEANEILSEQGVRGLRNGLLHNKRDWDISIEVEKFKWYCSFEGNKFLSTSIQKKCGEFIYSLNELEQFVGEYFYPSDGQSRSELWIPSQHRYKWQWDDGIWEQYRKLEPELWRLTEAMFDAYKSYRAMVLNTLFM
jgi:hypothetical protein